MFFRCKKTFNKVIKLQLFCVFIFTYTIYKQRIKRSEETIEFLKPPVQYISVLYNHINGNKYFLSIIQASIKRKLQ